MVALSALMALHATFDNLYGIGKNILHYMAMPRIFHNGFNFEEAKRVLFERQHPDKLDAINMVPQDVSIFKKRAQILSDNNKAYRIATLDNPSVQDLIDFSYLAQGWSVLFPLKHYIMHHMDKAMAYNGLLPYGSAVIAFVNSIESTPKAISSNPTYAEHVYLRDITNREAQAFNMPSVEINNVMYLGGLKLLKKKAVPAPLNSDIIVP
jgi:hypothetical protein